MLPRFPLLLCVFVAPSAGSNVATVNQMFTTTCSSNDAAGCLTTCELDLTNQDLQTLVAATLTISYKGDFGSERAFADVYMNGSPIRALRCAEGNREKCSSGYSKCIRALDVLTEVQTGKLSVLLDAASDVIACENYVDSPLVSYKMVLELSTALPPVLELSTALPPPPALQCEQCAQCSALLQDRDFLFRSMLGADSYKKWKQHERSCFQQQRNFPFHAQEASVFFRQMLSGQVRGSMARKNTRGPAIEQRRPAIHRQWDTRKGSGVERGA
jgi:hypothetical protein